MIIYAPGIHVGGGALLLYDFMKELKTREKFILDKRLLKSIDRNLEKKHDIIWMKNNFFSRVVAEIKIKFMAKNKKDEAIFLFSCLPLLFKVKQKVILYLHNKLIISDLGLSKFSLIDKIKIKVKRLIFFGFIKNITLIIVQTQSMKQELKKHNRITIPIMISAFSVAKNKEQNFSTQKKEYDFIYPAMYMAHKNHATLIQSWELLSAKNLLPTLVLTIEKNELPPNLINIINKNKLKIFFIGQVPYNILVNYYKVSKALIFPSLSESFGLPLIEAKEFGLPIIASEMSFVRDSSLPKVTFDPNCPYSIAQAIMRFMGHPIDTNKLLTTKEFVSLLEQNI